MIIPTLLSTAGCVIEPCSFHDECGGGEFCWEGVCEQVYDRTWSVEVVSAEVGATHPDGYDWDPLGGPPDLYAEFGLMPDVCATSVAAQTFNPVWTEACDFYVHRHATFGVDLWDVDSTLDELGASYTWGGEHGFVDLARTAGHDAGWLDESGTVLLWLRLWPAWTDTTTW
jgi:hypothetical protein